jgi:hypothetical protein
MVLVTIFMVLMLSLVGVAYRRIGAALRVESVRSQQLLRDQGSLQALAAALALLETGSPPSNPYVCGTTVMTVAGLRSYTITMSSDADNQWTVESALTANGATPTPMPQTFATP